MKANVFDALIRALTDESTTRRRLAAGLAGLALTAGPARFAADETAAKKRKKKRKKAKGRGGNDGGGGGGDGGGCNQTLCEGQCVNLDTDRNNCGACGAGCQGDSVCVGGRCAIAIGRQGDGREEFDEPTGVAVNGNGVFFVADTKNDRVQLLEADFFFGSFGGFGEDEGQFLRPFGVAVNATTGDAYVTDTDLHRVQRFDNTTAFVDQTGSFGSGQQSFNAPPGLAIDPVTDQLFVADTGNNRIARYSETLFFLDTFGAAAGGDGQFRAPSGLVIDAQRNVIVADTGNNRIQVVDQDGGFVRAFGRPGSGNGEFKTPVSVALDAGGNIFVVDQGNNRVQQFTAEGQFLKTFGRGGNGIGEFDTPFGIAIDGEGIIAVADTGNDRVQFFLPPDLIVGNALPGDAAAGQSTVSAAAKTRHPGQKVGGRSTRYRRHTCGRHLEVLHQLAATKTPSYALRCTP